MLLQLAADNPVGPALKQASSFQKMRHRPPNLAHLIGKSDQFGLIFSIFARFGEKIGWIKFRNVSKL